MSSSCVIELLQRAATSSNCDLKRKPYCALMNQNFASIVLSICAKNSKTIFSTTRQSWRLPVQFSKDHEEYLSENQLSILRTYIASNNQTALVASKKNIEGQGHPSSLELSRVPTSQRTHPRSSEEKRQHYLPRQTRSDHEQHQIQRPKLRQISVPTSFPPTPQRPKQRNHRLRPSRTTHRSRSTSKESWR